MFTKLKTKLGTRNNAGVILEHNDKFLIVHPSGWYNKNTPWSFPKGQIGKFESIQAGACREVKEETGIDIKNPVYVGSYYIPYSDKLVTLFHHKFKTRRRPKVKLCWENDQFYWVDKLKVFDYLEYPQNNIVWDNWWNFNVDQNIIPMSQEQAAFEYNRLDDHI